MVTVVSTLLYFLFSAKAVKEIDNSSKQMLSQVSYTADVVYKQIQDVTAQLLLDSKIDAFLNENKINKVTNLEAYLIISKVQSVYPFIANISLYNFVNGEYIDTKGLPHDPMVNAHAQAQHEYLGFYPRKAPKNEKDTLQLLTFRIVKEWKPVSNTPKSALVIDLNESYIQNTIGNINQSIKNADTFVMDASGIILSHSDSQHFMKNYSEKGYIHQILNSSETQGSFVSTIDHQKQLVTYVRSSTLDWFFVTVRPYNELLSDIYRLRNWTWMIAFIFIIVGAVGSLPLTGKIHNPIRALVDRIMEDQGRGTVRTALLSSDEYTLLSQAFMKSVETAKLQENIVTRSKQVLKNSTIVSILKGVYPSNLEQIEQEWGEHLKGPFFTVVLFKVDAFPSVKGIYSSIEWELIRFAIGNIAQECLGREYDTDVAVKDEEVAVILQSNRKGRSDLLHLTLSEINDLIQKYYKITVSISIGDWCDTIADLQKSYRSAQQYITYRFFFGNSCIVDAERTNYSRNTDSRYPSSKERKLIEAVKLCNDSSIQSEIDDWIDFVSRCTYIQALQYTNYLLIAVLREFEAVTEWWEFNTNNFYMDIYEIQRMETLNDLRSLLVSFCTRIVTALNENKQNISSFKNAKVIEEVKQLINENYSDPNLSLEYAAVRVGLSAGYLGKLFKTHVNITYNDYVTLVRLDHAKRLLSSTSITISDVAARVGFSGFSYFSTLFKKHMGLSPSQYRDNYLFQLNGQCD